ncbi:MAG: putative urea ABC transporter substrate-binding protein [Candidatus Pacebacteria bacterium]|nr:putative urea ABC transporter substrate-binding protein [Candidatus Paceibacterota bacterium]
MKMKLSVLLAAVIALAMGGITQVRAQAEGPTYKMVWSHYTGWEPWAYADSSGILAKNSKKYGVNIKVELINDYGESINRYVTDKSVVGVTITEMDALTGPCVGGVDTTVVVVGDYSNGNDGIVAKNAKTIEDLKGRTFMLVENSVSHYLLYRGLGIHKMPITDVKTKNVSDADISSVFTAAPLDAACVTWNPPLMTVRQVKGATEVFDSSKIPGEIQDLLVVKTDAPEGVKKALTATWYEVMKIMYGKGANTDAALEFMAKSAGGTRAEFDAQLKTTFMFNDPAKAIEFTKDKKLSEIADYVRTFCFDRGLYNGASSKDSVGIQFPDGSILGSKRNVKLRYTTTYMQLAADGKL